jgi:hypothetical protein
MGGTVFYAPRSYQKIVDRVRSEYKGPAKLDIALMFNHAYLPGVINREDDVYGALPQSKFWKKDGGCAAGGGGGVGDRAGGGGRGAAASSRAGREVGSPGAPAAAVCDPPLTPPPSPSQRWGPLKPFAQWPEYERLSRDMPDIHKLLNSVDVLGVSCYPRTGADPAPGELESCAVKYDAELTEMGFNLKKWTARPGKRFIFNEVRRGAVVLCGGQSGASQRRVGGGCAGPGGGVSRPRALSAEPPPFRAPTPPHSSRSAAACPSAATSPRRRARRRAASAGSAAPPPSAARSTPGSCPWCSATRVTGTSRVSCRGAVVLGAPEGPVVQP